MVTALYVHPAAAHPHPPLPAEDLADRLGVSTAAVLAWIKEGLPQQGGLVDPFACANWLSWGRLDRCPALRRRWQSYLRWFEPHLHAADAPQRYRARQEHTLFLPRPVTELAWFLPRPAVTTCQPQVQQVAPPRAVTTSAEAPAPEAAEAPLACAAGPFWRLVWPQGTATPPRIACEWAVQVVPHPVDVVPDHAELLALVRALVADFRYEYRHHQPQDERTPTRIRDERLSGSCLDCALELGRRLSERGRAWKLCHGVVASSAVANPHFWLKVDTTTGWLPVDPTLPAIARMLGADWERYCDAYVGGCDARRITLSETDTPVPGVPGGSSLGSRIGEAIAVMDGARVNAWPCIDWVCGECQWSFH